jgi:hypothetical protein
LARRLAEEVIWGVSVVAETFTTIGLAIVAKALVVMWWTARDNDRQLEQDKDQAKHR